MPPVNGTSSDCMSACYHANGAGEQEVPRAVIRVVHDLHCDVYVWIGGIAGDIEGCTLLPQCFFPTLLRPCYSAAVPLESRSLSISSPKYLNTARTSCSLRCERNCSRLILQSHSGELINSSLRALFNHSVK